MKFTGTSKMVGAPVDHLIASLAHAWGSVRRSLITFVTEVGDESVAVVFMSPAMTTGFLSALIQSVICFICLRRHSGLHLFSRCVATTVTAPVGDSGTANSTNRAIRPPRRTSRVIRSINTKLADARLPDSSLEIAFFSPLYQSWQTGRGRTVALRIAYRLR